LTGGEPLLREDIIEIVSYASGKGLTVGVTTNGTLLSEDALKALVDAGTRSIALSMDALEAEYDDIRGVPGSFQAVREAASRLAGLKKTGRIDAYVNFTLMKGNIGQLKSVKALADGLGLPVHICLIDRHSAVFDVPENSTSNRIHPEKDMAALKDLTQFLGAEKARKPHTLILNFPGIEFIKNYFRDPVQKQIPCVSSQDRIIIGASGDLFGGCLSMGTFGNVKETRLNRLLADTGYRNTKQNMYYKRCMGCSCGYMFNINMHPVSVIKDLASRIRNVMFSQ
ncbi:MAG: radical SAM protein, partial [Candidatus Omnitrophota bacterium]